MWACSARTLTQMAAVLLLQAALACAPLQAADPLLDQFLSGGAEGEETDATEGEDTTRESRTDGPPSAQVADDESTTVSAGPERARDQTPSDLPEGWAPTPLKPPRAGDVESTGDDPPPASAVRAVPLPLEGGAATVAGNLRMATPWGEIPFTAPGAYQYKVDRGPGYRVHVPEAWTVKETRHRVLDGMQHRYADPTSLTRVVVATFPMEEETDPAAFLAEHQVELLSSFKPVEARRVVLGRRTGIGVYYQGILLMRDAACHLFFTQYKRKGYVAYGLYFDKRGGQRVAEILQSLRIF